MSLSGLVRAAWIAVPAALVCGGALAQQIITVPSGMVLVLTPGDLPGTTNAPVLVESRDAVSAMPIERVFAEQQAMMDRMMADMNAMFSPAANPGQMVRAMMGTLPEATGPEATGPAATGPAAAGTFCEESVTVSYNGRDSKPVVKVSRTGDGCGPITGAAPVPAVTEPPVSHPRVLDISQPAAAPRVQHRT